jgi:hypothetical protein
MASAIMLSVVAQFKNWILTILVQHLRCCNLLEYYFGRLAFWRMELAILSFGGLSFCKFNRTANVGKQLFKLPQTSN